jgi:phage-related baseplate assembly protein
MTNLPEPNFINRDGETITKEWIALYEEKTGKTLQPAQIERILIDVGSYRENLLRIKIQEVAKSNLLSYAPMEVLEHLGELVGVPKLEGKYAKTTLRFEVNEIVTMDISIPVGTEVETQDGNFIFATVENVLIKAGSLYAEVGATCTTIGTSANGYDVNKINNLITPLSYVDTVWNIEPSYNGAEDEDVESLRERIRLAPESFSNAGSSGAYRFHTLSAHQSVIDVEVISSQAGVVDIYPLTETGNPTEEMITTISEYLSSDTVRPLTDKVVVHAPEKVDFTIDAILQLYMDADADTVLATVKEKMQEYKEELASQLGKDIVPTQIIAFLNSIYGVYKVDLKSPAYQKLTKCQWANLVSYNITIGETADE